MTPEWRDYLGRVVRDAWIAWATKQPNPKPSWLVPYDDLSVADQEADRLIGDAVWAVAEIDADGRIAAAENRIVELTIVGDTLHTLARHGDTCGLRHGSHCTCAMAAWERLTELRA